MKLFDQIMNDKLQKINWQFERLCVELGVPTYVKSRANSALEKYLSELEDDASIASHLIPFMVYTAVIDSSNPYGLDDPHRDKSSPCCTLGEILRKSGLNFIKFSKLVRQYWDTMDLSETVRKHISAVEKRYCIISPLFKTFEREWGTVFREEENQESIPFEKSEGTQEKKRLCWTLFLHAKDELMCDSEELIQTYLLLLCCLEFVLRATPAFLLQPPFDTLKLETTATALTSPTRGGSSSMLHKLADIFHTSIDELMSMHKVTQDYFQSLQAETGKLDVDMLSADYHTRQRQQGGLDELQFLQHEPYLMPQNNTLSQQTTTVNGTTTAVTPVRAAMNTVQQLKNLISDKTDHLEQLREHLKNCASKPEQAIVDRVSQLKLKFLSRYLETAGSCQGHVAEQRYTQATNLYYRVMNRLLDMEQERLAQSDFSGLLGNDVFHRSLLACSAEIVLMTYNVSWSLTASALSNVDSRFTFPWVLDAFGLYAFDFYKVLESYLKAEPNLTREIIKHLTLIENRILDSIAWKADSPVFELLSRCGSASSSSMSHCSDLISSETNGTSQAAEIYMSPSRGPASKGTVPGNIVFVSPRKGGVTAVYSKDSPEPSAPDTTHRSHSLNMFLNKVCRLGYHRLKTLSDMLLILKETQQKIWTCFEFCITFHPELLRDRHLDQMMMCSVYGICKVSDSEIKFKDIVKAYSSLPHANSQVYKEALLDDGTTDSIIAFYNRVYMQNMKNYILLFAKPVQPNLSPLPKPVSSAITASPVYSIPGRKNFYVSPLKKSPFKYPHSPCSMTPRSRQLYSFGEGLGSAEKLKSINESVSAFKSRSNLPYISNTKRTSSKRLNFENMDDQSQNQSEGIQDEVGSQMVVKKIRVTPPAPITEPGQPRRNSTTE
ncbi:retinoblastoma-associated protein-like isoform X3 [Mya arenaria]|uniref:retinoblastoma-associated protein-like isoform X3 n=1 Tax=Mya arenaria TaxID=6604 RepID=UPI0022E18B56|nr:retinoblastoma-associated protein-like isoform X3 [Mya arenaria]